MSQLPKEFDFLTNSSFDPEIKKLLLAGVFEERRQERDLSQKTKDSQASQSLENKRFWHNTPLMLALVGTITIFANGVVSYVLAARTSSDAVTLKELDAKFKASEERTKAEREQQLAQLRQQWIQESSDAEAKRVATREERAFEYKIIEQELSKTVDSAARAQVLLFLVRAKVITSLDRDELTKMATIDIESATGSKPTLGIPPSVGLPAAPPSVDRDAVSSDSEILFKDMKIDPNHLAEINQAVDRIVTAKDRYEGVQTATRVPWFVVGIVHQLETGGDFSKQLNGDRLPAGSSWKDSAIDLVKIFRSATANFSTVGNILYEIERLNGFGYRRQNVPSPYIWGCTNQYTSGKFLGDYRFDPNVVSSQCGAGPILKIMLERNAIRL